jgi:hypothetical protein
VKLGKKILGIPAGISVGVLTLALAGGGYALASSSSGSAGGPQPAGNEVAACVSGTGQLAWFQQSNPGHKCADGLYTWTWSVTGPKGAQGAQGPKGDPGRPGPKGDTGAQGPSGVIGTATTDLGGIASVTTGGSFVTNATEVGSGVSLKAGTYLISLNAKATPLMTSAVQVFPEFFVYNQAKNAAFTGDLFNVGSGALESGGNVNIDSYYSGSTVITLTEDTTLDIYAFGYDSDRGSGTYALDDLTFTATQIQPAS